MGQRRNFSPLLLIACGGLIPVACMAQNVLLNHPFRSFNNSFYERFETGFSYRNGNFSFLWNPQAIPPFGGYDPSADANLGYSFRGPGGGRFNLGLTMSQGSSRSSSATSPSMTIPNGGMGGLINATFQPFVTGYIPVIGGGGQPKTSVATEVLQALNAGETMESLLRKYGTDRSSTSTRLQAMTVEVADEERSVTSTAERGDLSVAEIQRQHARSDRLDEEKRVAEYRDLMQRGQSGESEGNLTLARFAYRTAIRKSEGTRASAARAAFERVNRRMDEERKQRQRPQSSPAIADPE